MTPVDITSVSDDDGGDEEGEGKKAGARRASVTRAIVHVSARPCRPVTTFVQPLLTTRVHANPAVCLRTDLEMVTSAAWDALRVKVAAADFGRDDVERRIARTRIEASFFTPLCMPPRR